MLVMFWELVCFILSIKVELQFILVILIVQQIGKFNNIRHLGAAWIDKCFPDILICESTYATTLRDSKRARETDFL